MKHRPRPGRLPRRPTHQPRPPHRQGERVRRGMADLGRAVSQHHQPPTRTHQHAGRPRTHTRSTQAVPSRLEPSRTDLTALIPSTSRRGNASGPGHGSWRESSGALQAQYLGSAPWLSSRRKPLQVAFRLSRPLIKPFTVPPAWSMGWEREARPACCE
jgi:hypothetical protein